MNITHGLYISLVNRSSSRIVFSAATDSLTEEEFTTLWNAVGKNIWRGFTQSPVGHGDRAQAAPWNTAGQFELRIERIMGEDS